MYLTNMFSPSIYYSIILLTLLNYNNMVHLILDENQKPIGWELRPITEDEQTIAGTIRDLQFFGFDDTKIKYKGLALIDDTTGKVHGNVKSVSWIQAKHYN